MKTVLQKQNLDIYNKIPIIFLLEHVFYFLIFLHSPNCSTMNCNPKLSKFNSYFPVNIAVNLSAEWTQPTFFSMLTFLSWLCFHHGLLIFSNFMSCSFSVSFAGSSTKHCNFPGICSLLCFQSLPHPFPQISYTRNLAGLLKLNNV